jgi:hypothetical protein
MADDTDNDEPEYEPEYQPDRCEVDWDRLQSLRNVGAIETDDLYEWYAQQSDGNGNG